MNTVYTEDGLRFWVNKSKPGSKIVYYTGFLMYDREKLLQRGLTSDNFPDDMKTAKLAWNYHMLGEIMLVQNKKEKFLYEYIAVKV